MSSALQSSQGVAERNREYFDSVANTYDTKPQAIELARRLASLFVKAHPFDEDSTEVMDYACGTGLISQHLAPHAKSITGVDISPGMVRRYNERVGQQGLQPEDMRAICIEPEAELKDLEGKFDVVVCAASYHHFPSIEDATRRLASALKPGGTLMVADLVKAKEAEDLYPEHSDLSLVCHRGGIAEADIRDTFQKAELKDTHYTSHDIAAKRKGKPVTFFLMTGRRS
ncbi:hexaprenyldihydroxybenzoate methyltransferase [Schizophyllum fasciatum]